MRIGKLFRRQTFLTKFECIYKISCSHCFPCARAIQKKARRLKWRKNDLFLYFIMVRFFHSLFYEGGKFKCFTFLTLMGKFFANFYHLLLTLSLTQWFNLVFVQNSLCRKKACKKNVSLMMMCSTKTYKSLTIQLTVYILEQLPALSNWLKLVCIWAVWSSNMHCTLNFCPDMQEESNVTKLKSS